MNNQEGSDREMDNKIESSQHQDEQLPPISFDDFRNVSSANETSTISHATEGFLQDNGQDNNNSPNVLDFQVSDEQVYNHNRQQLQQQPTSHDFEQRHGDYNFNEPFFSAQGFQDVKDISSKYLNPQQISSNPFALKYEEDRNNIPISQASRGNTDKPILTNFNFKEKEINQNEKDKQSKKQNGLEEQIIKYHEMQEILQRKKASLQNGQQKAIDGNNEENQGLNEQQNKPKDNIPKNNHEMPFKPSKQGLSWQFSNHLNTQFNSQNNYSIPSSTQQEHDHQSIEMINENSMQNDNVINNITNNNQQEDNGNNPYLLVQNQKIDHKNEEKDVGSQGIDLSKPSEDIPQIGSQNQEQVERSKRNIIREVSHYPSNGDNISLFFCQTCGQFGVCKLCQNHQHHLLVDLNNDGGFFQQKVATYMERLEQKQHLLEQKAQIDMQENLVDKQEALNIFQNEIQKLRDSLVAYETKVSCFIEENYSEFPSRNVKFSKLFNSIEAEKQFFLKTIEEAHGQSKNELHNNFSSNQDQQILSDSQVQQTCVALYAQNRDRIEQSLQDPSAENELESIIRETDGIFQLIKPLQIASDILLDKCKDEDRLINNSNKFNLKNGNSRSQYSLISQVSQKQLRDKKNGQIKGEKINNFDEIQQKIAEKAASSNDQIHWSEKYLNNITAKQVIINNGLQRQEFQSQDQNTRSFSDQKNKSRISTKTRDLKTLFQTELGSQNNNHKSVNCSPNLADIISNNNNNAFHEGFNPQMSRNLTKLSISAVDQLKLNKQLLNIEQILKDRNNTHFPDSSLQSNGIGLINSSPNSHRSFQSPQSQQVTPTQNSHPISFSDKKPLHSHSRRISLQNSEIVQNISLDQARKPQIKLLNEYDRAANLRLLDLSSSKAFSKGIHGNKFSLMNKTINLSEIGAIRGGLKLGTNQPRQTSKDQLSRGNPTREQPFALKNEQLSYCTKMISNLFKQKDLYNQGKQQFFD